MARPGKSIAKQSEGKAGEKYLAVGGRVRRLRAVEDQSAPIPEERTSELGGSICTVRCSHRGSTRLPLKKKRRIGKTRAVAIIPPTPYKVTFAAALSVTDGGCRHNRVSFKRIDGVLCGLGNRISQLMRIRLIIVSCERSHEHD